MALVHIIGGRGEFKAAGSVTMTELEGVRENRARLTDMSDQDLECVPNGRGG